MKYPLIISLRKEKTSQDNRNFVKNKFYKISRFSQELNEISELEFNEYSDLGCSIISEFFLETMVALNKKIKKESKKIEKDLNKTIEENSKL